MSARYDFRRSTRVKRLPPHEQKGSPQDPTPRMELKIDEIDLDRTYAAVVPPRQKKTKKNRPWAKRTGTDPITDPAELPRGWHMNEDDLEST